MTVTTTNFNCWTFLSMRLKLPWWMWVRHLIYLKLICCLMINNYVDASNMRTLLTMSRNVGSCLICIVSKITVCNDRTHPESYLTEITTETDKLCERFWTWVWLVSIYGKYLDLSHADHAPYSIARSVQSGDWWIPIRCQLHDDEVLLVLSCVSRPLPSISCGWMNKSTQSAQNNYQPVVLCVTFFEWSYCVTMLSEFFSIIYLTESAVANGNVQQEL